jgi:hypothetical protein
MTPRKFTAGVKEGKLPVEVAKSIGRAIAELDGRFCQVTVGEYVPIRSISQNKFYFGVVIPEIQAHLAQFGAVLSPDDIHEWTVREVWKHTEPVIMHDGSVYMKRLSSTKLTKAEWEDRIEMTRAYWAERGLMLSYPNE